MDPSYPGTKMEYLPSYPPDGIIHNYSAFLPNGSDYDPGDDDDGQTMNLALLPMSILIVWTFLGNALVLIAVYRERSLKSMSNYVIASLALADLLLSVLVMPLSLISVICDLLADFPLLLTSPSLLLTERTHTSFLLDSFMVALKYTRQQVRGGWGFGLALCVTHLSLDVLLCTASILHLCAIAVNRYLAVTFPLMYSRDRVNSQKRILGTIIPVWVVSIAICAPLFIQGFINPEKTLSEDGQACGFFDKTFIIYSSMGSFYVPLAVMIVVDVRAVRKLRGRKALAAQRCVGQTPPPQPSPTRECVSRSRSSTPPPPPSPDKTFLTVQGNGAPPSPGADYRRRPLRISFHMNRKSGQKLGYGSTVVEAVPDTRQKMLSNKREKRAAKTLVVVFACFIILWLPFFVMHLANGFCTSCQIPDELFIAFTWLGYVSSAFNPCIYTCFNKEYRRAFIRIICCGKKRRHSFRINETSTFRSSLRHS